MLRIDCCILIFEYLEAIGLVGAYQQYISDVFNKVFVVAEPTPTFLQITPSIIRIKLYLLLVQYIECIVVFLV